MTRIPVLHPGREKFGVAGAALGATVAAELAGGAAEGLAGALCDCACRAGAARSEAAKDNHNDGANVFILMVLGDPTTFVSGGREFFSPARFKALMRTMLERSLPYLRDDFTRV